MSVKPRIYTHAKIFLDKFLDMFTYASVRRTSFSLQVFLDRLYLFLCTRNLRIFFLDNFYEAAGVKCSLLHVHTSKFSCRKAGTTSF